MSLQKNCIGCIFRHSFFIEGKRVIYIMVHKDGQEKNKTGRNDGSEVFLKSRKFKIMLGVIILLAFLAVAVVVGILLPVKMFSQNPRFTLANVKVIAHPKGYWIDKKAKICNIMQIKTGSDNLFAFNLRDLVLRLKKRASIESVSVSRVLPDTLSVKIVEREPRALLNSAVSPYVVDASGHLMLRTECMNIISGLPVISGVGNLAALKLGSPVKRLEEPMEMIRIIKTKWPDITVQKIIVKDKYLICSVRYKSFPDQFRVEMSKKDIPRRIRELATALDRIVITASTKRNIRLLYENQAVLTDLPGRK